MASAAFTRKFRVRKCSIVEEDEEDLDEEDEVDDEVDLPPPAASILSQVQLVTNSILFCWLFTIKDRCKKECVFNKRKIKVCVSCY